MTGDDESDLWNKLYIQQPLNILSFKYLHTKMLQHLSFYTIRMKI